jgi:hypothetical protein
VTVVPRRRISAPVAAEKLSRVDWIEKAARRRWVPEFPTPSSTAFALARFARYAATLEPGAIEAFESRDQESAVAR